MSSSCRPASNVLDFGSAARTYWTLKYAGVGQCLDPRRRPRRLEGGGLCARQGRAGAVAGDFHRHHRQEHSGARPRRREDREERRRHAWSTRARSRSSSARRRRRRRRPMATFPARSISTAPQFYDPATNRLKPTGRARGHRRAKCRPAPTVAYCNTGHWAATDWFVLHELLGRKTARGSMPARWWNGPAMPAVRLNPRAPSGMT